jgi:ABC-type multidrug transport system fused ATPase/permease subunit
MPKRTNRNPDHVQRHNTPSSNNEAIAQQLAEQQVLQNIQRISQNRTVFLIAHRFAPLKRADLILVLEKGVIAEKGTHVPLLQQKGLYWSLYQRQQSAV